MEQIFQVEMKTSLILGFRFSYWEDVLSRQVNHVCIRRVTDTHHGARWITKFLFCKAI